MALSALICINTLVFQCELHSERNHSLKGESLGASNSAIGIVMGAYLFTTMFLRPWAGQVIHQWGPVKVLRVILVINALALSLYTFTGLGGFFSPGCCKGCAQLFLDVPAVGHH